MEIKFKPNMTCPVIRNMNEKESLGNWLIDWSIDWLMVDRSIDRLIDLTVFNPYPNDKF